MRTIERRAVLRGLAAGAIGFSASALVGCSGDPDGPSTSPTSGGPTTAPTSSGSTPRPPKPSDWRALAAGLDGALLRPSDGDFDESAQLYDPRFDGVRPDAVLRAASASDVAAGLAFASRHGVALRAKSGGHSYVGASTVRHGLVVSTQDLDSVEYDAGSREVAVGAGAVLINVHAELDDHGRTIPSGSCPTVGVSGLTLGGGVGVEMRAYGLTCDSVVSAEVVTADGQTRQVDADNDPDLFWALRGGGGGSFGVVTAWRFATSPAERTGLGFLTWPTSSGADVIRAVLGRSRSAPTSEYLSVHVDAISGGAQVRTVLVSLTGDAHAEATALESAVGVSPTDTSFSSYDHLDAVKVLGGCSGDGLSQCLPAPAGSFPRESFAAGSDVVGPRLSSSVAQALVDVVSQHGAAGGSGSLLMDSLGGAVADGSASRSAFPWRDAGATVQWYVGTDGSSSATESARQWISSGHAALGAASLGGYVNYLEPDRDIASYFGANVARLQQVRTQYDPTGLFDTPWSVPRLS